MVHLVGGEVTLRIESVEMGPCGGRFPYSLAWFRRPAIGRSGSYGQDMEPFMKRGEGLSFEERLDGTLAVVPEFRHLLGCVSFGNDGQINALAERKGVGPRGQ